MRTVRFPAATMCGSGFRPPPPRSGFRPPPGAGYAGGPRRRSDTATGALSYARGPAPAPAPVQPSVASASLKVFDGRITAAAFSGEGW